MVLNCNLITGRTIDQGRAYEGSKLTDDLTRAAAVVELDPQDLEELNIMTGTVVTVKTKYGEVVVRAVKSPNAPHKGIAFIPMGLWANQVISPETTGIGMPTYKGILATIEPTPGKKVLGPIDLAKSFKK